MKPTVILSAALLCVLSPISFAKPLKVFILAGQSNMEGHAAISTFDYIGKDPLTAPILKEMRNPDGTPRVCDKVWMSYLTGPYDGSANGEGLGKLTAGFGARGDQPTKDGGKIGPEFTFGIHMEEELKQPILIIKTAWGGRSLNTEFRPPSAGQYKLPKELQEQWDKYPQGAHGIPRAEDRKKWQDEKDAASGVFYRMMVDHVKKVLADPKRVCPEYDDKAGYELAGFVWLQGFNDLVDGNTYPNGEFGEYSRLLTHFIRDVRKDLSAPKMPFVIGVLGVDGEENANFRRAMAAPADMPEFKGNVIAVDTAPFWDHDIAAAEPKQGEFNNIVATAHPLKADGTLDQEWKWENYWKPVGKPLPEERIWRFATLDATEKKDKMEKYDGRRFRDITLPAGMENWFMPDFDDSKWTQGNAPIGKGVWNHSGITMDKFPSTWGDGEFLLMRTTFEVEDLNCGAYRIAVLARQGFHVYLNGQKIHTYIWWQDKPQYGSIVLGKEQVKYLKKGKNVLAVYSNDQYDPNSPEHYAAIDVRIEGITKADQEKLDLALEEVLSPKDRECLKGASNGGYHYFGSAKIFAQMGKAFAEALVSQKMPWEDPDYAKDISATRADSRAEERAKGGWTEFIRHHEDRKRWVTEKKVDILMIGDSIVFGWSREGHEVWNEHYGNRNAVNIGSSGDRTSHMLWHIQDGGLDGMKDRNPEVVVIMIGTNNRGEPANEGRDTAQGVLAILKEVHHRLPDSKILLLAIFPRDWKPTDEGRIRNDQVNGILKTYADNKTVYWLDLKETFFSKDGILRKDLMPDALHPNVDGYREWAKAMEPMLTELIGK